ncbi:D-alanyl-D-alanine carboxypeptidase/D-alanyl-D-alanine-endopeptidase [Bacteriovorax sp. PP10]|uniref:D-alanyl-D-alanine carboxypeptidase/D-alanyl-D-alanine-endopeptidase n=1 Tax=Bacteriovorax antarcticus TaxID=3088717 RepID=A0ABU5VRD7_9BACT|nr:D-alanyl-D-alanine carboxypeptidase/D-alanyl-D-alanine-endopeptidase [Bacteriovorax sp. PP10]MEA9355616.1 D-alanyl-D-alanine carboxypeptidase/D-alanyl-D-alanine-endopeptidase [Bacteriovorax sp. PP10]
MLKILPLTTLIASLFSTGLFAQSLQQEALALAQKYHLSTDKLSVLTVKVGNKKETLININADKKLTLASLSKIVTSYAVLKNFPPTYQFVTRIKTDGKIENHTLQGNLYLVGGGDPSFSSEGMNYLAQALKKKGIKKITGDIIVDDSYFDNIRYDESRGKIRADFIYDAPVGAMSYNWNTIRISVHPSNVGGVAKVDIYPPNDYVKVVGSVKTIKGNVNGVRAERRMTKNGQNILFLKGHLGRSYGTLVFEKNITHPDIWSGRNLQYILGKEGIAHAGKVQNSLAPKTATLLAEFSGKDILGLLTDLNKDSNNHVAEMLTKAIAVKNQKIGSIAEGVKIINNETKLLPMRMQDYSFVSPSGLSPDNQISSANILKIFEGIAVNKKTQDVFMKSLPEAGVDGTLKKRKIASTNVEWVKAKTGFITGAVSLGGYAKKKDGTLVAFSFIYNGPEKGSQVTHFYDQLIAEILDKDQPSPIAQR